MSKIICGLNIGNSNLTAVLAKADLKTVTVLASEIEPARGLSKGTVTNLASLVDSIQNILNKLKDKAKVNIIRQVLVGVNGNYVKARSTFAAIALSELGDRSIKASDIDYLRRQAKLLGIEMEEDVLHEFPQVYVLDDNHSVFDPVGLLARKIKLNSYILSASHTLLGNITNAVEQAGYGVENVVLSPIASSYSVLTEEEKARGVILLDLGGNFTNVLFFKDSTLRDFKIIKFGGEDVTQSISSSLEMPLDLAEDLKKSSLTLSEQEYKDSDKIVVKKIGSYKAIERKALFDNTKDKLDNFIEELRDVIEKSHWKHKMECGIVGVGGFANLEGLLEKIESKTLMKIKLGSVNNNIVKGNIKSAQFSASLGLVCYGIRSNSDSNIKNWLTGKTPLSKVINFLRNLYLEYF